MSDEIIETSKTVPEKSVPTNPNKIKVICKMNIFFILLAFLLITITLVGVSIYFPCNVEQSKNIY